MIPFELGRNGETIKGRIEVDSDGIAVYFDGYGTASMESGYGAPIFIEVDDNGHPVCMLGRISASKTRRTKSTSVERAKHDYTRRS